MPSRDGGHYFLTVILPIDNEGIVAHGDLKSSPVHMVREALETLPTALQSPASVAIGLQSPFARSLRTHFARFVVLDEPFYNGRDTVNAAIGAVEGANLLAAQPVDKLACPYLIFVVDFDPAAGADEPKGYLQELWELAQAELTPVFQYCYGFEAVKTPAQFADYVIRGEVDTTMPFNDYWIHDAKLPALTTAQIVAVPAVAALAALVGALASGAYVARVAMGQGSPWWQVAGLGLGAAILAAVLLLVVLGGPAVAYAYRLLMRRGETPFKTAPNSTLKDVLKALYLQQAFTRFAVAHQGDSPADLRAAFAGFVAEHQPDNLEQPTQPPGVIQSPVTQPPVSAHA